MSSTLPGGFDSKICGSPKYREQFLPPQKKDGLDFFISGSKFVGLPKLKALAQAAPHKSAMAAVSWIFFKMNHRNHWAYC